MNIYSQKKVAIESDVLMSPQGYFDKVVDDKGNEYNLSEIIAGQSYKSQNGTLITNTLLCTAGIFDLYFETDCGMEDTNNPLHNQRRAILCQVFQDYSDFINTPLKSVGNTTKVKIWVKNPSGILPSTAGGGGTAFYNAPFNSTLQGFNTPIPNSRGGIVDNEIWKTIHTGKDSFTNTTFPLTTNGINNSYYHGFITFNFTGSTIWNLDYNKYNSVTGFVNGNVDLYSIILHEATHALGFISLINQNGVSVLQPSNGNGGPGVYDTLYSRYDKFLYNADGNKLINNNPTSNGEMYNYSFNSSLVNNLAPSCNSNISGYDFNCLNTIRYQSNATTVPIYNPGCFRLGNSLSHFEDACFNNTNANNEYFLMTETVSFTQAKRNLQAVERQTLCDIGYSIKGTFGSTTNFTYKDYGTIECNGISVSGVNDGFNVADGYQFQGNSNSDIIISGFLNNDYTGGNISNLRYEFAQDLFDPTATILNSSGNSTTNIIFKSYASGVHLIRYVPYDIVTGHRGNITYIFVNVLNNCTIENNCSLVRNGNFEEHQSPPNTASQIYKVCGWQNLSNSTTADYFNSDFISPNPPGSTIIASSYNVPCNFNGFQNDKVTGNQAYIGMYIYSTFSEAVKTELLSTLLPNTNYRLSFDVSLSEGNSTKSLKFQAFITDQDINSNDRKGLSNLDVTRPNTTLITNTNFSNGAALNVNGWETITFNFITGNNPNLKYLYIGGLNNYVQNSEVQLAQVPLCTTNPPIFGYSYYYLDNVNLSAVLPTNYIDAVNDDLTLMPVNDITGGITMSVYTNDLFNNAPSTIANTANIYFSLIAPFTILGATISDTGLINIPPNTPAGNYTITYKLQLKGSCTVVHTATAIIKIVSTPVTPNLSSSLRANNTVEIIRLQSTGKMIVSGTFTTYNNITKNRFCRLNNDLTLDQSFYAIGPISPTNRPKDIAIQPDNKIIVAGVFDSFSGSTSGKNICRLMPDGSQDASFNVGGSGITAFAFKTQSLAFACAVQPDGKILVGGDFYYYNGTPRLGIVRLLSTGAIDNSFIPIELNNSYRAVTTKILVQNDGKILLQGFYNFSELTYTHLIRLNSNGSLDTSFQNGTVAGGVSFNVVLTSLQTPLSNMVLQPDNKIVVVGGFTNYNSINVNNIVRLLPNGALDTTFNTTYGTNNVIYDLFMENNSNKIIIGGEFNNFNALPVKKMIRLTTSGTIDNSFNIGSGTSCNTASTCSHIVRCFAKQIDDKIVIGGRFTSFNNLAAGNITRIYGDSGYQSKGGNNSEFKSEPEIDTNPLNSIIIYPNPSNGIFNIDLRNEIIDYNKLSLFNFFGMKILENNINSSDINILDLSHLSNGCYLIKIENESNSTLLKIIKN